MKRLLTPLGVLFVLGVTGLLGGLSGYLYLRYQVSAAQALLQEQSWRSTTTTHQVDANRTNPRDPYRPYNPDAPTAVTITTYSSGANVQKIKVDEAQANLDIYWPLLIGLMGGGMLLAVLGAVGMMKWRGPPRRPGPAAHTAQEPPGRPTDTRVSE